MNSLELLKIDLKSLVSEDTSLAFDLDDTYFAALDGAEVKRRAQSLYSATDVSTIWSSR